jgi:hypothetical protein
MLNNVQEIFILIIAILLIIFAFAMGLIEWKDKHKDF